MLAPIAVKAQFESCKDYVGELYGVVFSADSLTGLPGVKVKLRNQNRGTFTNEQGVFSIVVLKGDIIDFTYVGFKPKEVVIPSNIEGNSFSVIQLMVVDTVYLPATIIKARPRREQFEREFVTADVPADKIEVARQNTRTAQSRILQQSLPRDGSENSRYVQNQYNQTQYYNGQFRPQNIFNPVAWNEFIQAWKRGDFKKKN